MQQNSTEQSINESAGSKKLGPVRLSVIIAAAAFSLAVIILWFKLGQLAEYKFCATACIFIAVWIIPRRLIGTRNRSERVVFAVSLALLFVTVLYQNHWDRTKQMYQNTKIRTWNMYHYFIGSKYFDELHYHDLYLQTILADREDTNRLKKVTRVRDLTDYRTKRISQILPDERNERWSDQRWAEFKKDLRVFLPKAGKRTWVRILRDRGYNPTPFWNTIGSTLSHGIDIKQNGKLLFATSIDFILYAIMIGFLIWAFGIEAAMLSFLAFILLPFSVGRVVAGYVQYDWLAGIVAGVCLIKKRRPIAAAIALGFSTMARVFPLILTAGLGAPALRKLVKTRKIDKFYIKFVAAFLIVVAIGIVIGSISTWGFSGWLKWKDNISLHNYEMTFGEGRVGLKHIFIHKLGEKHHWENPDERKKVLPTQIHFYYVAAALFLILFFPTIWFRDDVNAVISAMILMYILLVPSHYYWSILMLLPLWIVSKEEPWTPALIPSLTAFVVPAGFYIHALGQNDPLARYIRFDWILGLCFLALMGVSIFHSVRRFQERKNKSSAKGEV